MNLLLLEPREIDQSGVATIDGVRARHVRDVLRVTPGAVIRVGVIDGAVGTAIVRADDGASIALACTLGDTPPPPRVDLLLALPRPKVVGRLYAVLAQLGVRRVMLTNAAKVERFYFDAHQLEADFTRTQLLEGLAQARDTRVPTVTVHRSFRVLVEDELDACSDARLRLLADPGAHPPLRERCTALGASERALLAVGPEGGWNDFERELLIGRGFATVSLGTRTLRTDVAITSLLALVHDAIAG